MKHGGLLWHNAIHTVLVKTFHQTRDRELRNRHLEAVLSYIIPNINDNNNTMRQNLNCDNIKSTNISTSEHMALAFKHRSKRNFFPLFALERYRMLLINSAILT